MRHDKQPSSKPVYNAWLLVRRRRLLLHFSIPPMSKQRTRNPEPAKAPIKRPVGASLESFFPYKKTVCYGVIAALTFALYVNTLWNEYALDDAIVITQNQYTQRGFKGIGKIMTTDVFLGFFKTEKSLVAGGRYRPLSVATFAVEHELFGDNPGVSHFINMLLYALTGIVLFVFLTRLLMMHQSKYRELKYLPLLASLLFIAHPIHTEAVANIKGRDEIMTLLFALLAADCFLKYYDARRMRSLIVGGVWFFLALLSKENAITWLAVIPMTFYFFRTWYWNKAGYATGAAIAIAGIYLGMRQAFTDTSLGKEVTELMNNPFVGATAAQKFATIIYTWGKYLLLLLVPYNLSHDYYPYQIPLMDFSDWQVIVSALVYVGLGVLALVGLKGKKLYSFCIIYFLATFSVVSNLLFPVGTFMSERFVYISSLSFCLYAAYLIHLWAARYSEKKTLDTPFDYRPAIALVALLILGYSVRTIARNPVWKNNYSLFSGDLKNSPNSAKLNNAFGGTSLEFLDKPEISAAEKKRHTAEAKVALKKAIEIYPGFTNAWLLLGNAYVKGDSNFVEGAKAYIQCLTINPNYQDAVTNLGVALNRMKDPQAATALMREATAKAPGNYRLWYYYGSMARKSKQYDVAIAAYKQSTKLKPDYGDAYNQIGLLYGQDLNQIDSSIAYLQKAVTAEPTFTDANDNLAVAYGIRGNYQQAVDVLQRAIQANPNHAKYYSTMGITYRAMGDMQKAQYYLTESQRLEQLQKK
jgi:protein O-mannosyl-transferase